jgi:hypothetical protein
MNKQYIFSLAIIAFLFTTCIKNGKGPSNILPEATQEGKNTMGMKVNGVVWTPYSGCFSVTGSAIGVQYHKPYVPSYYLSFGATKSFKGEFKTFNITSIYPSGISTLGEKYDSVNVTYTDYDAPGGWIDYGTFYHKRGKLIITKLDFVNEIISGTFDCTLFSGKDSVVITEGRFDCKFNTSVCN